MIDDILEFYGFYPPAAEGETRGVVSWQNLMRHMAQISPYFFQMKFAAKRSDGGLDILSEDFPDLFRKSTEEHNRRFPEDAGINVVSATRPFHDRNGKEFRFSSSSYRWDVPEDLDCLRLTIPVIYGWNDDMTDLIRETLMVMARWRPCAVAACLTRSFKFSGRVFPDRITSGNGIWLPADLSQIDLSDAFAVEHVNGGTLVLPVSRPFRLTDQEARDTVMIIDGHLAENGLLPTVQDHPYQI